MRRLLALSILCALAACARAPQPSAPAEAALYPAPPEIPRVQHLASIATADDLPRARSGFESFVLGEDETRPGVMKPYGVAMQGTRMYVCDTVLNNVAVFDFATGRVSLLGESGSARLENPINITIEEDGSKYVADAGRKQVVIFGADDKFVAAVGGAGEARPSDVAVLGDRLIVADVEGHQLEVWDRQTGDSLAVWGRQGADPGEFHTPTNLCVASDGSLFVTDTMNFRVQRLNAEGRPMSEFGDIGTSFGNFARPKGIAVDPAGRIYVADARFNNVQVFNREGELLMYFGGFGSNPPDMDLPADVAIVTDPQSIAVFADRVMPGHTLSHLILVSSQFGRPEIDVYGFFADEGASQAQPGAAAPHSPPAAGTQ